MVALSGGPDACGAAARGRCACAMLGGYDLGSAGTKERLASLVGEDIADLMAATCPPRSMLYRVLHAMSEPQLETLRALAEAMQLLDREHPQGIAGWRFYHKQGVRVRNAVSHITLH